MQFYSHRFSHKIEQACEVSFKIIANGKICHFLMYTVQAEKLRFTLFGSNECCGNLNGPALSSVEDVEPEADERRFQEIILLTINNRKTRFWVVARLQLRAVEHSSIEISFVQGALVATCTTSSFKIE
jgi:hypothetical protein